MTKYERAVRILQEPKFSPSTDAIAFAQHFLTIGQISPVFYAYLESTPSQFDTGTWWYPIDSVQTLVEYKPESVHIRPIEELIRDWEMVQMTEDFRGLRTTDSTTTQICLEDLVNFLHFVAFDRFNPLQLTNGRTDDYSPEYTVVSHPDGSLTMRFIHEGFVYEVRRTPVGTQLSPSVIEGVFEVIKTDEGNGDQNVPVTEMTREVKPRKNKQKQETRVDENDKDQDIWDEIVKESDGIEVNFDLDFELERTEVEALYAQIEEELELPEEAYLRYQQGMDAAINSGDIERMYYLQAANHPLLTHDEIKAIFAVIDAINLNKADYTQHLIVANEQLEMYGEKLRENTREALRSADYYTLQNHIVLHNQRLIISIARKFEYLKAPMLDRIQEGNLGLIHTIEKYEVSRGHHFSTYATYWIRQKITRGAHEQERTIRLPEQMITKLNGFIKMKLGLRDELNREPSVQELVERYVILYPDIKANIAKNFVQLCLEIIKKPLSLEHVVGDGDDEFGDFVSDENADEANTVFQNLRQELLLDIIEAVGKIDMRKGTILKIRYGYIDGIAHTLEDTAVVLAQMLGEPQVSRERVRQLEKEALKALRKVIFIRKLTKADFS